MPVDSVQRAIDLLEKGRAEQAAPLLEDVVDAFPTYPGAYVLLARSYEAGERWSRALEAWRTALWLVPDSPVALEGLRRSLRQGRRTQAFASEADRETMAGVAELHRSVVIPSNSDMPGGTVEPESVYPPDERTVELAPSSPEDIESTLDLSSVAPPAPSEPPTPRTNLAGTPADDNLERLISELESARITPRPDIDEIPTPDFEDDIEDMVSETLARIYASQGQHLEAARVYDALARQHPDRADYFIQKAGEMRGTDGDQT